MGIRLLLGSKAIDEALGITPTGTWTNAANATDGNDSSFAQTPLNAATKVLTLTLPSPELINKLRVRSAYLPGGPPTGTVYLEYWDGVSWILVTTWPQPDSIALIKSVTFGSIMASMWRHRWTWGGGSFRIRCYSFSLYEPGYPASGEIESTVIANPVGNFTRLRLNAVTRTTVDGAGNPVAEAGAVRVYLTADGGVTWFILPVGAEILPDPTGNQLKYRMQIDSDPNGDFSPDVSFVEIAYAA